MVADLLEVGMLVCFMAAWPMSIVKLWRSRTAKGVSLGFMAVIEIGYACGMASKFASGNVSFVISFYAFNFSMVALNMALYLRNLRCDAERERGHPDRRGDQRIPRPVATRHAFQRQEGAARSSTLHPCPIPGNGRHERGVEFGGSQRSAGCMY